MPLLPEQPKPQKKANRWINEVLYGIINAIVGAPTMISFAAIVYQVHPSHAVPCDAAGCHIRITQQPLSSLSGLMRLHCQGHGMLYSQATRHSCKQASR